MAGTIKTKKEIDIIREGGKKLATVLDTVVAAVRPGISTLELDARAERLIFESGGEPSFKGYRVKETHRPYPCTMCISINDEVVHAIPRKDAILKEGDVVGLDIGMKYPKGNGFFTDIAVVRSGITVGDIGYAVQNYLETRGYGVIRDLAGHGVGYTVHEDPLIPNF